MINFENVQDALISTVGAAGIFENVLKGEPRSAPQGGLDLAVWCDNVKPAGRSSGLSSTSALVNFSLRIYANMSSEPEGGIDVVVWDAYDMLMENFADDFTLGGLVRSINLQGADGSQLAGNAGYLVQDKTLFRIVECVLPVTINDAWQS